MATLTRVPIEGKLEWRYHRTTEGPYVAMCDEIGITLEADSLHELAEDIELTIDAMFKDMLETHDLEHFLQKHGWRVVGQVPNQLADVQFEVPVDIIAAHANDSEIRFSR